MDRKQLLLTVLMEECAETAQRASKAIRFTPEEIEPNGSQTLTNAERIVYEFNDIVAVMEVLKEEGVIEKVYDAEAIKLKKAKIEKWIKYSQERGTVEK